jgi:predicted regulator of Ras-like GTPase activity (Roadblock/LC7/MglB family)
VKLRTALQPLLTVDGLVAVLVLTADGLPVEMFGYGLRAERLAAEIAGVARCARLGLGALGLGEPKRQQIRTEGHDVDIFPLEEYCLVVIKDSGRSHEVSPQLLESALGPLREALRGGLAR